MDYRIKQRLSPLNRHFGCLFSWGHPRIECRKSGNHLRVDGIVAIVHEEAGSSFKDKGRIFKLALVNETLGHLGSKLEAANHPFRDSLLQQNLRMHCIHTWHFVRKMYEKNEKCSSNTSKI